MADIKAALRELDRMEGILRTRYHYPHPIFGHIEAARTALAEEPKKAASTVDAEPKKAPAAPAAAPKSRKESKA